MQLVPLMIHQALAAELTQQAARLALTEDDLALNVMLHGLATEVVLGAEPIPQPVYSREYAVPAVVADALSTLVVEHNSTNSRAFHDFSEAVFPGLHADSALAWSRCEGVCEEDEETHLIVHSPDDRALLQCRFECPGRRFPVRYRWLQRGFSDLAARALISEKIFLELNLDTHREDCDWLDFTNDATGEQHSSPYPPPSVHERDEEAPGASSLSPSPSESDTRRRLGEIGLSVCVDCGSVAKPADLLVCEQGPVCEACHDLRERHARSRPWWKLWG